VPIYGYNRRKSLSDARSVRIGTAFPLDDNNLFQATTSVTEQAKSNLINLLLTVPGERVNLPNFGVGLKQLLFENKINTDTLETQIKAQSEYYIPNIKVTNVKIVQQEEHKMYVTIHFRSVWDNTPDSIKLNFN